MSLAPLITGESGRPWREYIHGECVHELMFSTKKKPESSRINLVYEKGSHYLTDGKMKYIWYDTTGTEQLFNTVTDYKEQHDLSVLDEYKEELRKWRARLVKELEGRPEGFSDGEHFIAGKEPVKMSEKMLRLSRQRQEEGFSLAFARKKMPEASMSWKER